MIKQNGYTIIIEDVEPPKSIVQSHWDKHFPSEKSYAEVRKEMNENIAYKKYIENLKNEIRDYVRQVFAKDVSKEITQEAVKCIDGIMSGFR